jgi:hypothetical protein
MLTLLVESIFWSFVGVGMWVIIEKNYLPVLPNWTLPIIAVMLNSFLLGIKYIAKLQVENMEARLVKAITESKDEIIKTLGDKIEKVNDKVEATTNRVSKLEGKEEGKKEFQKV